MEREEQIKIRNVFNDGCDELSFVHIETDKSHFILYATVTKNGETHTEIYELALEEGMIPEDIEPSGGGIFNLHTLNYERGSIHYGQADPEIIAAIERKLPDIVPCE